VGWKQRLKLKIPAAEVTAAHVHFPVYINLSTSSGINSDDLTPVFDELLANSLKIAVTTSDGTSQLYVEVVSWDSVTETAELWVSRSTWTMTSGADNYLYLYYDHTQNDNSSYVGVTGSTPAETVWDANFKMVQHMNDATTSTILDSTSNDNDGTKKDADEPIEAVGQIVKAQDSDGVNDYTLCGNSNMAFGTGDFSVSLWAKYGNHAAGEHVLLRNDDEGVSPRHIWSIKLNGNNVLADLFDVDAGAIKETASYAGNDNTFHQYTLIRDGDNLSLYREGTTLVGTVAGCAAYNASVYAGGDIALGRYQTSAGGYFDGIIDEVQVYSGAFSSAWRGASYETQRDHFWQLDSLEEQTFPEPAIGWKIRKRRPLPRNIDTILAEAIRDYLEMKQRVVSD